MQRLYSRLVGPDLTKTLFVILAFSLPLDRVPSFDIYNNLTIKLSVVVGGIIILVALKEVLTNPKSIKRVGWLGWLLLSWLGWLLLGLTSVNNFDAATLIVVPLTFFVLMALSCSLLWKREFLAPAVKALLIGATLAAVFGIYQFIGNWAGLPDWATAIRPEYSWQRFGFPRIQSTMLEPLYFSAYLLLPIGVLLGLLLSGKKVYRTIPYLLLLGALLTIDIFTLSRGGIAALIIMSGILAFLYWQRGSIRRNARPLSISVAVIVAAAAIVLLTINIIGRQGSRSDLTYDKRGAATVISHFTNFRFFANKTNLERNDSIGTRERGRDQVVEVLRSEPSILIFGIGAGQYEQYAKERFGALAPGLPNNALLEQWMQAGILGVLLLASFFIGLLLQLFRFFRSADKGSLEQILGKVIFAYLIALGLQAQTFSGLGLTHLWFAVGLALFLVQLHPENRKHNAQTS